jgi:hypothetical protein
VVQEEARLVLMGIDIEMIHPASVERRDPPLDAMDHIALAEQERRQIGAVLTGAPGDQRNLFRH